MNRKCKEKGMDFSDLMVRKAAQRNAEFIKDGKLEMMNGDFCSFRIDENSFSKVFGVNVIYFWSNLEAVAQKLRRILIPGRKVLFNVAHKWDLEKLGFSKTAVLINTALKMWKTASEWLVLQKFSIPMFSRSQKMLTYFRPRNNRPHPVIWWLLWISNELFSAWQ